MKARSLNKQDARLLTKENKQYGIVNYGEDNCYPQRVFLITNTSPTAKACLETYGRFIEGNGFKDALFYKSVVNSDGQTNDKILRLVRKDFQRNRGFALHVNVNALGKITEVYHVPFEHVRMATELKKEEDEGYEFAIYPDWDKQKANTIKEDGIIWLHKFNLSRLAIAQQVIAVGGWENYKGQLIYISSDEGTYPLASCDAVLEAIFAEIQSDITTTNNIEQNFTAKGILGHKGKFEDDAEEEEFNDNVAEFLGPEGGSIMVVDLDIDEEMPDFTSFPSTANDKIFEYTDKKVLDKIIRNWMIPKILLSVTADGGFFNQEQIRDATMYYNMITASERLVVAEVFSLIGKNFERKINATDDYEIAEIEFKLNKNEPPAGVVDLIKDTTMTVEVRRSTLVSFYGLDPETAKLLVPDPIENQPDKLTLAESLQVGTLTALMEVVGNPALTEAQKKNSLMIIFGLDEEKATQLSSTQIVTP